ncbi:MAG: peptide MFS transporter [bacterium]
MSRSGRKRLHSLQAHGAGQPAGFSQPRGLYVLFLTEMWERFSYYGMRALLVLYLVDAVALPRVDALEIYATYTALVYLTPILGGYIADRWLGRERAVLVGGVVMALGHFAMAFESMLFLALGLLVAGNGFFKPNISTLVGTLYKQGDTRRDSGFTLFYMGINLGAFLAPLVCGTLGEKFGWHWGFASAGVGMVVGVGVFAWGRKHFIPAIPTQTSDAKAGPDVWSVLAVSAVTVATVYAIVTFWQPLALLWNGLSPLQAGAFLGGAVALMAGLSRQFGGKGRPALSLEEKHRIAAIFILGLFVVFFWMGFEQAGGTMNLFARDYTDRNLFGWEMPASYFQSLNPLLILIMAPVFSVAFMMLDRSPYALSTPTKMACGMIILGLGFAVLAFAQERADVVGKVSPFWLVVVYWLHTVGELFLSPVGLAMVTRLAPLQLGSLLMGLWFTGIALANYLAGTLESILQSWDIPLYWFLVGSSVGAGLLLLLFTPLIKYLMHEKKL